MDEKSLKQSLNLIERLAKDASQGRLSREQKELFNIIAQRPDVSGIMLKGLKPVERAYRDYRPRWRKVKVVPCSIGNPIDIKALDRPTRDYCRAFSRFYYLDVFPGLDIQINIQDGSSIFGTKHKVVVMPHISPRDPQKFNDEIWMFNYQTNRNAHFNYGYRSKPTKEKCREFLDRLIRSYFEQINELTDKSCYYYELPYHVQALNKAGLDNIIAHRDDPSIEAHTKAFRLSIPDDGTLAVLHDSRVHFYNEKGEWLDNMDMGKVFARNLITSGELRNKQTISKPPKQIQAELAQQ